jgi:hypothetical protein
MLHPNNGIRPVREGIAGSTPPLSSTKCDTCRNLLKELCDDEQQTVKVTKLHKKYTDLIFLQWNVCSKYLDESVVSPAPINTYDTWSIQYVVEKHDEAKDAV